MKIERGYAEYSDKAIKRDAVKQEKPTAPQTENRRCSIVRNSSSHSKECQSNSQSQ